MTKLIECGQSEDTKKYCAEKLEEFFQYPVSKDVVNHILNMENTQLMREYLTNVLTPVNDVRKIFIETLISRVKFPAPPDSKSLAPELAPSTYRVIRKQEEHEDVTEFFGGKKSKKKARNKREAAAVAGAATRDSPRKESPEQKQPQRSSGGKYVPLYGASGKEAAVTMVPGRAVCVCQASKHRLIRNCLSCGRVVCEQEGAGPCLFCGDLVATREDMDAIRRQSSKGRKLYAAMMKLHDEYLEKNGLKEEVAVDPNLNLLTISSNIQADSHLPSTLAATEFKDRLLNYDKNAAKRTQVIDDECDYFAAADSWKSPAEREAARVREQKLRDAKEAARRERRITLDIEGRLVAKAEPCMGSIYEEAANEDRRAIESSGPPVPPPPTTTDSFPALANPSYGLEAVPQFVPSAISQELKQSYLDAVKENQPKGLRLQDSFLQEMTDQGVCLSMHQPYASLLVAGIKRHEGREWYTTHRGRLWIASTAKIPDQESIQHMERQYQLLRPSDTLRFPESYPSGCLLGCVDVVECLTHEQYVEQYPEGECTDSYVWICENPVELPFKFPVLGKPKLWKLENHTFTAAKKSIKLS